MYKRMLTMITILCFSQVALADKTAVFKCIDSTSLKIHEECIAKTFAQNISNDDFYTQIADKAYEPTNDAFASMTYYPQLNLIQVKSIEPKKLTAQDTITLIASR